MTPPPRPYSHIGRPPLERNRRQCIGTVGPPQLRYRADADDWSCRNAPVWWIPEVPYCANHLPPEWIVLARRRLSLWSTLADDLWRQVLAELPLPTLEAEPPLELSAPADFT